MAKSKKQSDAQKTPDSTAAGKKAPASKKASKPATATTSSMPQIDTSLAAQSAANMIANRDPRSTNTEAGDKRESGSFKQLKANLSKPAGGPASFLQSTAPQKKSNLPFGGRKQVGHNQTFGADVNRTGVPRRTGG
jgi:hypothetical protein